MYYLADVLFSSINGGMVIELIYKIVNKLKFWNCLEGNTMRTPRSA